MSSASDPGGLWDDGIDPAVRCADCEKTDGLANDLDPVDQMPIPADALAGFPDGVPLVKRHDRKSFLRRAEIQLEGRGDSRNQESYVEQATHGSAPDVMARQAGLWGESRWGESTAKFGVDPLDNFFGRFKLVW